MSDQEIKMHLTQMLDNLVRDHAKAREELRAGLHTLPPIDIMILRLKIDLYKHSMEGAIELLEDLENEKN